MKWMFNKELLPNNKMSLQNEEGANYDRVWETLRSMTQRELPLFVLTPDNHVMMMDDIDFEKRSFKTSAQWDPQSFEDFASQLKIRDEDKKKMVMRQIDKVSGLMSEEEKKSYGK
jgi:hypothetical protein